MSRSWQNIFANASHRIGEVSSLTMFAGNCIKCPDVHMTLISANPMPHRDKGQSRRYSFLLEMIWFVQIYSVNSFLTTFYTTWEINSLKIYFCQKLHLISTPPSKTYFGAILYHQGGGVNSVKKFVLLKIAWNVQTLTQLIFAHTPYHLRGQFIKIFAYWLLHEMSTSVNKHFC